MVEEFTTSEMKDAVVRICPACGVVNPPGPSESCPHLQLIRFEGVDKTLEGLLDRFAKVRVQYRELLGELRDHIMRAAQSGEAEVVATRKNRFSEVDDLRKKPEPLVLTSPKPKEPRKEPKQRKQRKSSTPEPVDPRQLALLAREPPQGDA
jgi:hypothetical protein